MSKINDLFKSRTIRLVRAIVIVLLAVLLAGFPVGYFVKKYIVSHSEEWICRKISIGSIFINPLSTSVTITDFKLYEQNSDSVFLSFDELHVDAVGYKLLFKKIQLEEILLKQPKVRFVMTGDALNIDDMLKCLTPTDTAAQPSAPEENTWSYQIENVNLKSGDFGFYITDFKAGIGMTKIELSVPLVSSDVPAIDGFLNFNLTSGGDLRNNFHVRTDSMRYSVAIEGDSVGLGFVLPFVDKFLYVSDVKGRVDTRLTVGGKFDAAISEAVGFVKLSDFQVIDTAKIPVIGVDRFEIGVDTVSALKGSYALRHVLIDNPFFIFGITPYGNTLMRGEGDSPKDAAKTSTEEKSDYTSFFRMINHYFIELGKEYAIRYYAIDTLRLNGGKIIFDDYTLNEQMHFLLEDVSFESSKLSSDQDSIKMKLNAKLNHSGLLKAQLAVMPKDTGDLKLYYTIDGLKVSDFSPYSEYYVAHPFWDGVVYFTSNTVILSNELNSKNHLIIKNLEVGDKVVNKTAYQLPLKLAVSILKDVHGNIEMTVPVKGNVNDPKFRPLPIVLKIFKDLIVKAVAAPFKLLARTFNASEDDLKDVKYDYLQFDIRKRQEKSLNLLARVLNQKKDLKVRLVHMNNPEWEMKQYALFEEKKTFYIERNQKTLLNADDSTAIDQITRLDSAFIVYLKLKSGLKAIQDVETTCITLVGESKIQGMMAVVNARRVTNLTEYLQSKVDGPNRFAVEEANNKDKSEFRDRPRFLILFEAAPDSTIRK